MKKSGILMKRLKAMAFLARAGLIRRVAGLPLVLTGALAASTAWADTVEVSNIRFGYYPDHVRAVLDLKEQLPYRLESSSDGRTVSVLLPTVKWTPPPARPLVKMQPLVSYSFHPGSRPGESQIDFVANQPIKVLHTQVFLPDQAHNTHRIMLDLIVNPGGAQAGAKPVTPEASKPPAPSPLPSAPPPAPPPVAKPLPVTAPPPSPVAVSPPPVAAVLPPPVVAPPIPAAAPPVPPVVAPPPPPRTPPSGSAASGGRASAKPASVPVPSLADQALEQGSRAIVGQMNDPDYPLAVRLFRKAMILGSPGAAFNLGELYRTGKGVPQDLNTAAAMYEKASQAGLAPAQFALGVLLFNGNGVAQDRTRGYDLFQKSAAQSYEPAKQALEEIAKAGVAPGR